jgi:histidyl-tRNA synthetase
MTLAHKIDPLSGFVACDETNTGTLDYYGFVDSQGNWYILKYDITNGNMRYAEGYSEYATAWTARATQTYLYFNELKLIK